MNHIEFGPPGASLPAGFYAPTDRPTDYVSFCPSPAVARIALDHSYTPAGACPGGTSTITKLIAARPGDVVDYTVNGIAVNDRFLPWTSPLERDSAGRPLEHYPFGHYVVRDGTLWVASTYHPQSYDSRYYGPIPESSIVAHVVPVLGTREWRLFEHAN